ncbi:hypothetical protein FIBSPDRAFT_346831 [Athelia psychrophila]|uniref:F-box domain-containing protein n=1 Tax=Athelia psychrophila TaxID=1759441 RepID=A0A166PVR2_9AGAM|nr:hypothetical protein FIBSPDRAFT_346831 [Fibularhizoctonia sp. CBS 109695]
MYERLSQEIFEMITDQTLVENFSERDDACHRNRMPESARDPDQYVKPPLPLPRTAVPLNPCLSACALVSRSWVQRSRHHHFRSLDFRFFHGDELAAFVDIIRSPLSTINLHVTEVKLD